MSTKPESAPPPGPSPFARGPTGLSGGVTLVLGLALLGLLFAASRAMPAVDRAAAFQHAPESVARVFERRLELAAALEDLPSSHREELEKILDELVSNVLKHSGASHVRMRLATGATGVLLRFSDDGAGFDPSGRSLGSGIGNIRYRVQALGGSVRIETAAGKGTLYAIAIPVAVPGAQR